MRQVRDIAQVMLGDLMPAHLSPAFLAGCGFGGSKYATESYLEYQYGGPPGRAGAKCDTLRPP